MKFKGVPFSGKEKELVFPVASKGTIKEITYEFKSNDKLLLRKDDVFSLSLKNKKKKKGKPLFRADKVEFSYFIGEGEENDYSWKKSFVEDEDKELFAIRMSILRDNKKFVKTIVIPA